MTYPNATESIMAEISAHLDKDSIGLSAHQYNIIHKAVAANQLQIADKMEIIEQQISEIEAVTVDISDAVSGGQLSDAVNNFELINKFLPAIKLICAGEGALISSMDCLASLTVLRVVEDSEKLRLLIEKSMSGDHGSYSINDTIIGMQSAFDLSDKFRIKNAENENKVNDDV